MAVLEELVIKYTADVNDLKADVKSMRKGMRNLETQSRKTGQTMSRGFRNAAKAVGILGAAMAAARITQSLVKTSLSMERLESRFQAATKDADVAAASLQFVRDEAERLGLDLETTAAAFSGFEAAALRTGLTFKEIKEVFTVTSEAAVTMRLDIQTTNRVFVALEQIASKGVLSMEELRQQLGEALPTAFSATAAGLGITTQALNKLVGEGAVSSRDFFIAFTKGMKEDIGEVTEQTTKSVQASLNRMNTAFFNLKVTVAEGDFINSFTEATKDLTDTLNDPEVAAGLKSLISGLTEIANAAIRAAAGVATMFSTIRTGITDAQDLAERFFAEDGPIVKATQMTGFEGVQGPQLPSDAPVTVPSMAEEDPDGLTDLDRFTLTSKENLNAMLEQADLDRKVKEDKERNDNLKKEQKVNQLIFNSKRALTQDLIGLLSQFASKSKVAALASLALQKGLAIAEVIVSTQVAATRALAELGPIAGAPVAASIETLGKVRLGVIAATGLAQAASIGGGGASGVGAGAASGGGSPSTPGAESSLTGPSVPEQVRTLTLNISGIGREVVKELAEQLLEFQDDGGTLVRINEV